MYGDDKKEAFIKEYLRSKVIIETSLYAIFKKVKPFEKNFGKDASEFTREEILTMLKEFRSKRKRDDYGVYKGLLTNKDLCGIITLQVKRVIPHERR